MVARVIYLHLLAPAKPAEGLACNGCGVCCAAAPCPLGMWVSRRRTGACAALSWSNEHRRYWCGVVAEPARWLRWWPQSLARRLAQRWIAAAAGCDSDLTQA
jgi:hypothetical protein